MTLQTDTIRPNWANRIFSIDDEDFVGGATSFVCVVDETWFFGGPLGEFLREMHIPRQISIFYDMSANYCLARLAFEKPRPGKTSAIDGQNADERWRVLYTEFEPLSFALLWNSRPETVHGLPASRLNLHCLDGDEGPAIVVGEDIVADLVFDGQAFFAEPSDFEEMNELPEIDHIIVAALESAREDTDESLAA